MEKVNISNDLCITNICFGTSALGNMPELMDMKLTPLKLKKLFKQFSNPQSILWTHPEIMAWEEVNN